MDDEDLDAEPVPETDAQRVQLWSREIVVQVAKDRELRGLSPVPDPAINTMVTELRTLSASVLGMLLVSLRGLE